MNKWAIIGIIGGLFLLILIGVAATAASIGGEASRLDNLMKQDMTAKSSVDDVKKQLAEEHYEVTGGVPTLDAVGPVHSLVVYQTHLTLKIDFTPEGKMNGYHLDRV